MIIMKLLFKQYANLLINLLVRVTRKKYILPLAAALQNLG